VEEGIGFIEVDTAIGEIKKTEKKGGRANLPDWFDLLNPKPKERKAASRRTWNGSTTDKAAKGGENHYNR